MIESPCVQGNNVSTKDYSQGLIKLNNEAILHFEGFLCWKMQRGLRRLIYITKRSQVAATQQWEEYIQIKLYVESTVFNGMSLSTYTIVSSPGQ